MTIRGLEIHARDYGTLLSGPPYAGGSRSTVPRKGWRRGLDRVFLWGGANGDSDGGSFGMARVPSEAMAGDDQ